MCLLEVHNLTVLSNNSPLPILNGVHLKIKPNRITTLVGESGSGKTTFSKTISGLLPKSLWVHSGEFYFHKKKIDYRWLQKNRSGNVFYTPQNASASLNPVKKIKKQISEINRLKENELNCILSDLSFADPERIMNSYPYELSGGENQRCLLAMAIVLSPHLLILDEPSTALDGSAYKDFAILLKKTQDRFRLTVLILSHALEFIGEISDYFYVIWNGSMVDEGDLEGLISHPHHFYTRQITDFF